MKKYIAILVLLIASLGVLSAFAFAEDDEGQTITLSGHDVQILPLSVVTESETTVFDITATTARVNFVGTIPLACYLVYGEDESFGFITNDPDMASAAIIDHNPVLTGLTPDTEYTFRMQGIGEDGVIYVSEIYTFRTLPEDDDANANLLSPQSGASVIEVSSNFGGGANDGRWGIFNAFDGIPATEWSSAGDGDDAYFIVDLGDLHRVHTVEYITRSMSDGTAITQAFTLTIDSGETFTFEVDDIGQLFTFDVDFETTTIRYDVLRSTGGNTGIIDIALFGEQVE